jgi:hypothetical protein
MNISLIQWREFRGMLKKIKGVFKLPRKRMYIGRIIYGTPYFYPIGFCGSVLKIRKLKLTPQEKIEKEIENRGRHVNREYIRKQMKFSNLPMVRRSKDWIIQLFDTYYWIQIGWPISFRFNGLGWKDKYDSPRFEWSPTFSIYFFKWQFVMWWLSPEEDNDRYWEMVLWYLYYSDENIKKAEETWGWVDYKTKEITWNNNNLL